MNWWCFAYLTCGFFFLYMGIYVCWLNKKSLTNLLFLKLTLESSCWAFGLSLQLIAPNVAVAMWWRIFYITGCFLSYTTMVLVALTLMNYEWSRKNFKYLFLLYLPAVILIYKYSDSKLGEFFKTANGWIYLVQDNYFWLIFFDLYYLGAIVMTSCILYHWKRRTKFVNEQKQASIIIKAIISAAIFGTVIEKAFQFFEVKYLSIGVFCSMFIVIFIWIAINKYQMMQLTQKIVADYVLQTMLEPVLIMNHQMVIKELNPAAALITGYSREELLGRTPLMLMETELSWETFFAELEEYSCADATRLDFTKKTGEPSCLAGSGVSIFNQYQEKLGSVIVLRDITQQKINEELLENAAQELELKILKIRQVFDSIDQGILTFGSDLLIKADYSLECERLFGTTLTKQTLAKLLYPEDLLLQEFTNKLLQKLFELDDAARELYLPLLPQQVVFGQQTISLEYKMIAEETEMVIMVIITDVTEQLKLERTVEQEEKNLKMMVKIILNRDAFLNLISDYRIFINESSASSDEVFLRQIHTFKGNFSQYFMCQLVRRLDSFESELLKSEAVEMMLCRERNELLKWLQEELELIKNYVGTEFFLQGEQYYLRKERLDQLQEKIETSLNIYEAQKISSLINSLRYRRIDELLRQYTDELFKLDESLAKRAKPLVISGDRILVDEQDYHELCKALVVLFDELMEVGSKTVNQEIELGVSELSEICCEIYERQEDFSLVIREAGRPLVELCEDKVWQECLSFAIVQVSVTALGGTMEVQQSAQGVNFIINLPKKQQYQRPRITAAACLEATVCSAQQIMLKEFGLSFASSPVKVTEKLEFNEITVLIKIKGVIDALVLFSFNHTIANHLFEKILFEVDESEKKMYLDDVVRELSNTILGNALLEFGELDCLLEIGLPTLFCSRYSYLKNFDFQLYSAWLSNHYEQFQISILVDSKDYLGVK